ncbi:MAG: DUF1365 family protein [Pyrinomonadaceae bacterium]
MNSLIYTGEVRHTRRIPLKHSFRYPYYFYAFDVDELPELARQNPFFGHNRLRPVTIKDKDYLHPDDSPLRAKVERVLNESGFSFTPERIVLVTAARFFNYVFNPISFFYCYAEGGRLECVVCQVNNTYGEMHLYVLGEREASTEDPRHRFSSKKAFHVSPFFKEDGHYVFRLSEPREELNNRIDYHLDEGLALVASIRGRGRPLTTATLLKTVIAQPLGAVLTMPRIIWQAVRLYRQKKLPAFDKPVPDSPMTIRVVPEKTLDRIGRWLFGRYLSRLEVGEIEVTLPDGRTSRFGKPEANGPANLRVREFNFFKRVLLSGDIGFGESYTAGEWDSDDLPKLLTVIAKQHHILDDDNFVLTLGGRLVNYLKHLKRANTLSGSARNIREHYDLSNEMFQTILDPSMSYSCAHFESEEQTLAEAQKNKIRRIIDKAEIGPDDHVLEIGCGWGALAIETVRRTGCRVTGITLSNEQLALAKRRVAEAGLEDRIELKICDYRKVEGSFSHIVSVEMLEAVGHRGIFNFFSACDRLLKPGGRAVIQVITIPDERYNVYRFRSDWIRKHIFPGGHLPSVEILKKAVAQKSDLQWVENENRAADYARTLAFWRENLFANRDQILNHGFDEDFMRTWDYYFASCEAGFAAPIIGLHVITLEKPGGSRESG